MAIDAVLRSRTPQGAIAWSVSLVSMPILSVPAYLVFGRSKFQGMAQSYEDKKLEIDQVLKSIDQELKPHEVPPTDGPSWHNALTQLSGRHLLKNNQVSLLINGPSTFDNLINGIEDAREYILFQFYMIHDDGLGNRIKQALIKKAKAGVRVYVLYDEIGSSGLPKKYIKDLISAGVEVSAFKPTQGRRNSFQLNFRNHRKMVVVDGKVGWVGGHNVGDEYLGLDAKLTPWRDTHVRIEGPAVLQLQLTILADWYWAVRSAPQVNWTAHVPSDGGKIAMIFPFSPTGHLETASLFFVSLINAAQKRVWLSAPYFVPDSAVIAALQLAGLRGVDVRILISEKSDSLPVHLAAFHYMEGLIEQGIAFYEYQGFLHEKVLLVDDEVSTVGTPNFDNRSFRLNFEVTAVMVDKDFANEMQTMFEDDFQSSKKINLEELQNKPIYWRVGVKLSRLLAPIL